MFYRFSIFLQQCVNKHDYSLFRVCSCITVAVISVKRTVREGNESQIWKKAGGRGGVFLWHHVVPFHGKTVRALSDRDYHPSPAVPFHTGPHVPLPHYQLHCHQPSHSFLFFPLTKKQRSRKGQCVQRRVGLSSRLYRSIRTTRWKDCIQSVF